MQIHDLFFYSFKLIFMKMQLKYHVIFFAFIAVVTSLKHDGNWIIILTLVCSLVLEIFAVF